MEHEDFFIHKLEHRHIKPTATRLLILQQMYRGDEMISLPELERLLPVLLDRLDIVLIRVFHVHDLSAFHGFLVVQGVVRLENVQPVIDGSQQLFVILVQGLFLKKGLSLQFLLLRC